MKESEFLNIFKKAADEVCESEYNTIPKAKLYYELYLDKELEFSIKIPSDPKRGYGAFEVDICIFENINGIQLPRIAIEFKTKITTHDIITYSAKAGKHKTIYPSLRYGLIASEIENIPSRFFIHNEHIDFFIAAKKYKTLQLLDFVKKLIEDELLISKKLEKIFMEVSKYDYYKTDIIFKNFFD